MTISHSVLPRMRNFLDRSCGENQNTHFIFNFFFFVNRPVYEVVWKYGRARQATEENIRCRMRIACWENKATNKLRI